MKTEQFMAKVYLSDGCSFIGQKVYWGCMFEVDTYLSVAQDEEDAHTNQQERPDNATQTAQPKAADANNQFEKDGTYQEDGQA